MKTIKKIVTVLVVIIIIAIIIIQSCKFLAWKYRKIFTAHGLSTSLNACACTVARSESQWSLFMHSCDCMCNFRPYSRQLTGALLQNLTWQTLNCCFKIAECDFHTHSRLQLCMNQRGIQVGWQRAKTSAAAQLSPKCHNSLIILSHTNTHTHIMYIYAIDNTFISCGCMHVSHTYACAFACVLRKLLQMQSST